ncbi:MAG: undecaprenyldiphospho-muramoylpentapeptide beta-N-acetylglucosaminyltransferase [Nitrosomonadales bacterium]
MKIKSNPEEIRSTIFIAAAGTGGHIIPALSVSKVFLDNNWEVYWAGTYQGMENDLVDKKIINYVPVNIGGFRGKKFITLISYPFKFLISVFKLVRIIKKYNIRSSLVFGGYISLPLGLATLLCRRNLYIHEQNSIPGTSNKILAPYAKKVFSAFSIKNKFFNITAGNPIRDELKTIEQPSIRFRNRQGPLRIFILGGSLGAKSLNEKIPLVLNELAGIRKIKVIHQCGNNKSNGVNEIYKFEVEVLDFIKNIKEYYQWADIIISRAGAMTVSELEYIGLGAIFIPYPYAIDDHQYRNALSIEKRKGALICREEEIEQKLLKMLKKLSRKECINMAKKSYSEIHKNSSTKIFTYIEQDV